jgi:hypothetical protein
MSCPTQTEGFLALPTELQPEVYKYILAGVAGDPSPRELAPYAGLLLSCKEIYANFEYERVKTLNIFLQALLANTRSRILPIKNFHDAAHICIICSSLSSPMSSSKPYLAVEKLANTLRRFTVRLGDTFEVHNGSVYGFFDG